MVDPAADPRRGLQTAEAVERLLALDHPDVVDRVALLDCLPISEHLARADARFVMGRENHAEWRAAVRDPEVVRGTLEDDRAGLTVDRRDEEADRAAGRAEVAVLDAQVDACIT